MKLILYGFIVSYYNLLQKRRLLWGGNYKRNKISETITVKSIGDL